ncbi:MAG: CPBP family intramembrane metalloprotease [Spirochaetaceae bacterium]|nr:CPBP family intramembrane metalloprotease [Spirochaetaceae bacterium]
MYQFAIGRELARLLGYTIPSLLLLWYLFFLKGKKIFPKRILPGDFQSLIIALPGLLGIGLGISVLSSILSGSEISAAVVGAPGGPGAWIVMILSCFSTGYLEETYFRHYLLSLFGKHRPGTPLSGPENPESGVAGIPPPGRGKLLGALCAKTGAVPGIALSTALFSLCHIYEGPWGMANAVLAGLFLSLIYTHYGAIHGLAWAHGLYNIFVYANGV